MARRRAVRAELDVEKRRADLRRRLPLEGRLRPLARARAEAAVQPQSLPLQLALALGLRQRRHRQSGPAPVRHRALGPQQGGAPGQDQLRRRLLRAGVVAGDAEHPHVALPSTPTARSSSSRRAATAHERRGHAADRQPVLRHRRAGCGSTATAASGSRTRADGQGREGTGVRRARRAERQRSAGAHQHRVAPLPELRRRHPRQRSEAAHVRHPRGPPVVGAAALANIAYRTGRSARVRRQDRDVRERQGRRRLLTREYRKGFEIPKSFS